MDDPQYNPITLGMMDPENMNGADPRTRLMQALMLSRFAGGGGQPSVSAPASPGNGANSPSPMTTTASEPSTGRMFTGEVIPPQPRGSVLDDPNIGNTMQTKPAGFDDAGMPTEFAATARKEQAHKNLENAMHPPHGLRNSLIMGGLGILGTALAARGGNVAAGAGAAQGFNQGMQTAYQRRQVGINRANEQYQFESGMEEKQREDALREKIAMSQLEATKAYRDLLVHMRERGQDITQRGQDIGLIKSGLTPGQSTPGQTPSVTPTPTDELPEVKQAMIRLQQDRDEAQRENLLGGGLNKQKQANTERGFQLKELGIRTMAELRRQQMQQSLNLGLTRMEMPTGSVRSMGETAVTVLPHIEQLRQTIDEAAKAGLLGPLRGRVSAFLAGRIGSTGDPKIDNLLGRLKGQDSLMSSAMLRTHFGARGGQGLYGKFIDLLDTGKATPEMLNGVLDDFKNYAEGYAQAAGVDTENFNEGGAASFDFSSLHRANPTVAAPNGLSKKPKGVVPSRGGSTGSGGGPGTPPPGAKVRSWKEFTGATAAR